MSERYAKIVEYANDLSTNRLALIVEIIDQIKSSGATFSNITKFSKEVALRLGKVEGTSPSYTALVRKKSPYREEVEKGFIKCSAIDSLVSKELSSDVQTILEYKLALKDKNDEIERQKKTISILLSKVQSLETTKLEDRLIKPETAKSHNYAFFKYLSDVLNCFCQPMGPYIFDSTKGLIINPMTNLPEIKDFPDGFLEFYVKNYR